MNPDRIVEFLVALGVGGIFVEAIRSFAQRRKMGADYADVVVKTALGLIEPLEHRIDELEHELEATKTELSQTKRLLRQTQGELRATQQELHKYEGRQSE